MRRRSILASALLAMTAGTLRAPPALADPPAADEAEDLDEPEYPPPAARTKVVVAGVAASAVFYGAAAGMSFAYPDTPGVRDLRVPVIGPWIAIAHNGCAPSETDCSHAMVALRTVLSALDGVAQAGGLAIVLEGLFMPTQQPAARAPARTPARPTKPGEPSEPEKAPESPPKNLFWVPTPMTVGARGVGFGIVGRF